MKEGEDVFANIYAVELLCSRQPAVSKTALLHSLSKRCPGVEPLDPDLSSPLVSFVHPAYPVTLGAKSLPAQTFVGVSDKRRCA